MIFWFFFCLFYQSYELAIYKELSLYGFILILVIFHYICSEYTSLHCNIIKYDLDCILLQSTRWYCFNIVSLHFILHCILFSTFLQCRSPKWWTIIITYPSLLKEIFNTWILDFTNTFLACTYQVVCLTHTKLYFHTMHV